MSDMTADNAAELARLRAEVARLQGELEARSDERPGRQLSRHF